MEYYSGIKRNAFESVLIRWMKLEPIIQSEASERKTLIQYINAYICNLERWNNNRICKTAKETQIKRIDFLTLWEKARVGWFGRITLKNMYITICEIVLVQVQCMKQGAQSWCTVITQRDGMGREWEWVLGRGTHVHLWLIHICVMTKNHHNIIK